MEKTAFDLLVLCSVQCDSSYTAQKMKFSINDFFSKYDQIRWNKSVFWAVLDTSA